MKKIVLAFGLLFIITASNTYAALMDVSSIKIQNAIPTWLQVTEVIAVESVTGNDLALVSAGATATASSSYAGTDPSMAIDGLNAGGSHWATAGEHHSGGTAGSEYLLISLAAPSVLDELTIFGRSDCCSDRDIYNLFIYDAADNLLFSAFNLDATGSSHSVSVSFVPEPSIIALMGLGIAGMAYSRRRKLKA